MIERLRRQTRRLVANALYYSGILWITAGLRFTRTGFVLAYHRVLPEESDSFSADGIIVRPRTFAKQIAFLKRHFRVLSLSELEHHLATKTPLPWGACVITFDDGWSDNFEHALPILARYEVPAIVFVATDFIGSSTCFWQERLARLMFKASQHEGPPRALAQRWLSADLSQLEPDECRKAIRDGIDRLKTLTVSEVSALERAFEQVLAAAGAPCRDTGDDRFMSWEQVRRLAESDLVSIGCHGKTHTPLTAIAANEVEVEITQSQRRIATETGRAVTAIAYPNGNFSDSVIDVTRAAGYIVGFTTSKGVFNASSEALRLPRINVHEGASNTMPEFLSSILLVFRRLRRTVPVTNANPSYR